MGAQQKCPYSFRQSVSAHYTMYAGSQMHHEQCYCLWWVWAYAPEHQVYCQFFVLYEQTYAHEWRFASQKVYSELENLTDEGFGTWVSALHKMADALQLDLNLHPSKFRQQCQRIVRSEFIKNWTSDIADTSKHPILRTYRYIKSSFRTEPYI